MGKLYRVRVERSWNYVVSISNNCEDAMAAAIEAVSSAAVDDVENILPMDYYIRGIGARNIMEIGVSDMDRDEVVIDESGRQINLGQFCYE